MVKLPRMFPAKTDKAQSVTDAGIKSNRPLFKSVAYGLVFLWMLTFMFGLSAIWVPSMVIAGNFSGTAWFFGFIATVGSVLWAFLANEFMDVS